MPDSLSPDPSPALPTWKTYATQGGEKWSTPSPSCSFLLEHARTRQVAEALGEEALKRQWLDLLLAGNVPGSRIGEKHGRSGNLPPPPPPPTAHRPPPSEAVDRRWRETDRFKDDLDPHLCLHFGQVEGCACCMWGVVSRGEKPQGREGRSLLRRSPRRKQKTNG